MNYTKTDTEKVLCYLVSKVGEFYHNQEPHDCFCSLSVFNSPVVSEKVLDFILWATCNQMKVEHPTIPEILNFTRE